MAGLFKSKKQVAAEEYRNKLDYFITKYYRIPDKWIITMMMAEWHRVTQENDLPYPVDGMQVLAHGHKGV